jgi:hypothetical protein
MKLNEDLTYNERLLRIQNLEAENLQLHVKNIKLRKELNEVGRKWLNDFSRQDTQITELKAKWEELKEELWHLFGKSNAGVVRDCSLVFDIIAKLEEKKEMK